MTPHPAATTRAARPEDAPQASPEASCGANEARRVLDAAMSEAELQALVIGLARRTGWTCYHTRDSRHSERGFPDLVLVHPGHGMILFRELKTERGKLTADQERWRDLLLAAGCDWRLWRPRDWPSVEMALIREEQW